MGELTVIENDIAGVEVLLNQAVLQFFCLLFSYEIFENWNIVDDTFLRLFDAVADFLDVNVVVNIEQICAPAGRGVERDAAPNSLAAIAVAAGRLSLVLKVRHACPIFQYRLNGLI